MSLSPERQFRGFHSSPLLLRCVCGIWSWLNIWHAVGREEEVQQRMGI